MRRLAIAGIGCVVALVAGCASPPAVREPHGSASRERATAAQAAAPIDAELLVREGRIEEIVRRYVNDVRFRQFDSAVVFVEPALRTQFRDATDDLRTVRFTGATIEEVELDESGTTAIATVRWRGHWLDSPFERELRTTQRWRRDAPSQKWYVAPELEALGANLQNRRAPAASMPPR